jgi:GTP cyclohydrolase III
MTEAIIQRVQNNVYLDTSGSAIDGFRLYVYLPSYDETLIINVPNMQDATVKKAVDGLVKQRDALAKFSLPATK